MRDSSKSGDGGLEFVANYTSFGDDPREFARRAEATGFFGVGCADHVFRNAAYPHLWVTASAMAAATEHLTIMSSFSNNLLRSPVEFAQASLTLHWLSGERFEAGLGAGWLEAEVRGAGLVYPVPRDRARRFYEAVVIARGLFDHRAVRFEGEHYTIDVPIIGAPGQTAPPLVASLGGPWTIEHIAPLVDRVELKFGATTRGGALDASALARSTRAQLVDMVAQVRAVAPETPLSVFAMIGVGSRSETEALRDSLGDGLYADFVGERGQVLDALRSLGELGIERVQVSELLKGSIARLGDVR